MAKRQKRRSVSMAPATYRTAERSAEREGVPVARWVRRAIEAYADPDLEGLTEVVDEDAPEPTKGPDGRPWRTG